MNWLIVGVGKDYGGDPGGGGGGNAGRKGKRWRGREKKGKR